MQAILSTCRLHYVLFVAEYVVVMVSLRGQENCLLLNVLISMSLWVQHVPACLSAELSVVAVSWIFLMDFAHFALLAEAACHM